MGQRKGESESQRGLSLLKDALRAASLPGPKLLEINTSHGQITTATDTSLNMAKGKKGRAAKAARYRAMTAAPTQQQSQQQSIISQYVPRAAAVKIHGQSLWENTPCSASF